MKDGYLAPVLVGFTEVDVSFDVVQDSGKYLGKILSASSFGRTMKKELPLGNQVMMWDMDWSDRIFIRR